MELIYTGRLLLSSSDEMKNVLHFVMKLLQIDLKLNMNTTIEIVIPDRSIHNKIFLSSFQSSPTEAPIFAEPIPSVEDVNANIKPIATLNPKIDYIQYALKASEVPATPNLPNNKEAQTVVIANLLPNTSNVIIPNSASPLKITETPKEIHPSTSQCTDKNVPNNSVEVIPQPENKSLNSAIKTEKEFQNNLNKNDTWQTVEQVTPTAAEMFRDQMLGDFPSIGNEFEDQQIPMDIDTDFEELESTVDFSYQDSKHLIQTQIQTVPNDVIAMKIMPTHQPNEDDLMKSNPNNLCEKSSFTIVKTPSSNLNLETKEHVLFIGATKTPKALTQDITSSNQDLISSHQVMAKPKQEKINHDEINSNKDETSSHQKNTSTSQDPNYIELVKSAILVMSERKGSTIKSITKHVIENNKVT